MPAKASALGLKPKKKLMKEGTPNDGPGTGSQPGPGTGLNLDQGRGSTRTRDGAQPGPGMRLSLDNGWGPTWNLWQLYVTEGHAQGWLEFWKTTLLNISSHMSLRGMLKAG